ncbi:MAG: 2,5-dichloro-2,5-cyclohexadiene-1,4-diol dehydrogenase [Candidatus Methanoperedens nitroreducens]|uniref:2,5-dichloro-2,5-cyclohexadiene-1,4-diol dehydrogenase n=1 Tax=Candidatus Methanoperedens nitratireducens TaxID=1392998 RepID=A0A0P7ZII4_9EURY|nr:beta-ketoacyl-ACP reductase [Candidatus Methanoperedens sp. BLZ2]KAB2942145.1 MAG: beta-ketoacyl-ACP reductase [Candidatus Methanoperedens sp.]KPQ44857.1 MAG: 2,5-dichloro-2,5-cyclohexadiene-1,4-diol dehydrogenase [Candidatus Methanoperedens sp. BLZ1]MBZ0177184.1 beta-ketoacyl-ACP reductase [Candidatus Methanoperedens nitroreducens]MCX9078856.1 beta-ketoacyl-ACP reductase [Candidatus Methanoperedens sp.]
MTKKGNLDGKVVLVTGGSRGIGQAIAMRLAEDGAYIAINYQSTKEQAEKLSRMIDQMGMADEFDKLSAMIDQMETKEHAKEVSELLDSIGTHSMICQANVNNFEEVNRMRDDVVKQFGKIDILVNNAGIVRDKSFVKMTPQMWSEVLSVNLDGAFYCTKAVIEGMLERKYGKIVNISSVIGRMGNRGQANYAASKAGMIALTQTLAKEFAGKGITVNAVAPGFIETEMLKSVPKEIMDKILAQIPLGRLGKPSEVAGAVAYLVSEDGDYITGQVVDINGGLYI